MREQLGFLIPGTTLELLVWFCLSATAGICEEIIFRGYLQRQFAAFTGSMLRASCCRRWSSAQRTVTRAVRACC